MALTAWDLGGREELADLRLRRHAHAFGFTGQLITKSQGFSTTFGSLRAAQAAHMAEFGDPTSMVLGTYRYAGRGYSDPRGETVAELLHAATVELHQVARERRIEALLESRDDSRDGSRVGSHGSRDRSRSIAAPGPHPQ
jgi:hypothetical protein